MTSPLLAIARGALGGALQNRATEHQRQLEDEQAQLRKIQLLTQAGYTMRPAGLGGPIPASSSPVLAAAQAALSAPSAGAGASVAAPTDPALSTDEDSTGGGWGGAVPRAPSVETVAPASPASPPGGSVLADASSALSPMHRAALNALSTAAAPHAAVPVQLKGMPAMEFDLSEAPETKDERAARIKDEQAAKTRERRKAMFLQKVQDPVIADILADRPELYKELVDAKPETQSAYFDRLTKGGMSPEAAGRLAFYRFHGNAPANDKIGETKEPNWQIHDTDHGTVQINPKTGEVRPVMGTNGAQMQGKVAPGAKKVYADTRALGRKIDNAITLITANPDAVGLTRGVSDAINQRVDQAGIPARSALADIATHKLHDLSGAAVTASEAGRFKPYIPSITDNAKTALRKLKQLKAEVDAQQQDYEELYPGLAPQGGSARAYHPNNPYAPGGP